jgi:hypothetical protein
MKKQTDNIGVFSIKHYLCSIVKGRLDEKEIITAISSGLCHAFHHERIRSEKFAYHQYHHFHTVESKAESGCSHEDYRL